ncbi:MAG: hypothetical protein V3T88_08940 [Nitrosomonadaceae bacterium]
MNDKLQSFLNLDDSKPLSRTEQALLGTGAIAAVVGVGLLATAAIMIVQNSGLFEAVSISATTITSIASTALMAIYFVASMRNTYKARRVEQAAKCLRQELTNRRTQRAEMTADLKDVRRGYCTPTKVTIENHATLLHALVQEAMVSL